MNTDISIFTEVLALVSAGVSLCVAIVAMHNTRSEARNLASLTERLLDALVSIDKKISESEASMRQWMERRLNTAMSTMERRQLLDRERVELSGVREQLNQALSRLKAGESIESLEREFGQLAGTLESPYFGSSMLGATTTALFGGTVGGVIGFIKSKDERRRAFQEQLEALIELVEMNLKDLDAQYQALDSAQS